MDDKKPIPVCVCDQPLLFSPGSLHCCCKTVKIHDLYEASPSHSDGNLIMSHSNCSHFLYIHRIEYFLFPKIDSPHKDYNCYVHQSRDVSKYVIDMFLCSYVKSRI